MRLAGHLPQETLAELGAPSDHHVAEGEVQVPRGAGAD
jgi:hypothetical protein